MNRKTIEEKIITALPGNCENSVDCGLPFYNKGDDFNRQMNELAERIYSAVMGFAEKAAEIAYAKSKK